MSPKTIQRPEAAFSGHQRPSPLTSAILAVVIVLFGLAFTGALGSAPTRVDQLTIENPSEFELFIESRAPGAGWMPLAAIRPHQTFVIDEPVDKGPQWELRVSAQGRSADAIAVSRDELASLGWRYVIPPRVADQLRALGAPASPGG